MKKELNNLNSLVLDLQSCDYDLKDGENALKQHMAVLKGDHTK